METHNYLKLVKNNTCFKGSGSCIDSILTSRKYCFQGKHVIYRNYKHFQWQHFEYNLTSSLNNFNGNFDVYEKAFTSALNSHVPKKVKLVRGNHKPHLNKKLRKAIMETSRLKNKPNKSKQPTDIASYKKQRNLVVSLNRQSKLDYFNPISSSKDTKPFWKQCKSYFSNKHATGDYKIMLIENDKMILDNESVSEKFNNYFSQIVDSLDLYEFSSKPSREYAEEIDNIVSKFKTHPSIVKIKKHFKTNTTSSFSPTSKDAIVAVIKDLQNNKATGGEIPLNILNISNFTFHELTECVNYPLGQSQLIICS